VRTNVGPYVGGEKKTRIELVLEQHIFVCMLLNHKRVRLTGGRAIVGLKGQMETTTYDSVSDVITWEDGG
jgi:hypothetical protein